MGLSSSVPRRSIHISQPPGEAHALGAFSSISRTILVTSTDTPEKASVARRNARSVMVMRVQNPDQYADAAEHHDANSTNTPDKIRGCMVAAIDIKFPTPYRQYHYRRRSWMTGQLSVSCARMIYGLDATIAACFATPEARIWKRGRTRPADYSA